MYQIQVNYEGKLRTNAIHLKSKKQIVTDAPVDNNGKGEAFSPTDLVCSALASCMLTIMGIESNKNQFEFNGATVDVQKIMSTTLPRKIVGIKLQFSINKVESYSKDQIEILKQAALTCPVALSLHPDIRQEINFNC
jgi:uncharacterized OsmC-like protein